jgi:BASS family bile acid:Na+ symporter
MSLQTLILFVLKASLLLNVFAIGLKASVQDATYMFRTPGKLAKILLAMYILMPLFAVAFVLAFHLKHAVEVALMALAVSPVPPILPRKLRKAGATEPDAIGLLVAVGLLAIIFVPVAMEILERVFHIPLQMTVTAIAAVVLMTIVLPLGLGILVHTLAPVLAERLVNPLAKIGTIGLLLGAGAILFSRAPAIWELIGNGTLVAMVAFVLVGLLIGHFIGGPKPENRAGLAMATASRHPGIASALVAANFPEEKVAIAAVLLYLLVNAAVWIPYHKWTERQAQGVEKRREGVRSEAIARDKTTT